MRRTLLSVVSAVITVTTIVTVLTARVQLDAQARQVGGLSALDNPRASRVSQVLLIITIVLVVLAVANVLFITWATALDARRPLTVARALGTTPQQVTAGLSAAQVLPALAGAILGIPAGLGLYAVLDHGQALIVPPAWWLLATVLGTLLVVAGLTAIPARIGARRPVAEILQSETV